MRGKKKENFGMEKGKVLVTAHPPGGRDNDWPGLLEPNSREKKKKKKPDLKLKIRGEISGNSTHRREKTEAVSMIKKKKKPTTT